MADLHTAIAIVVVSSVGTLLLGLRVGRRISNRSATFACGLTVAFLIAHVSLISDRLWVTRILPVSNVVILGDLLPPAVCFLAGLAWRVIPGHPLRRGVLIAILTGLCVHRSFRTAFAVPPGPLAERWRHDVCLQTSPATCSAAAAATLLCAHGIDATEAEMARLCLSTERGTSNHGLYRGLKLKTAGTAWDVEAFHTDAAGLRAAPGLAILSVRLDPTPGVDPRYEKLWGWTPGVAHSVVFFGFVPDAHGKVEIGDPAAGREHWSARDVDVLWHGEGLRLARR